MGLKRTDFIGLASRQGHLREAIMRNKTLTLSELLSLYRTIDCLFSFICSFVNGDESDHLVASIMFGTLCNDVILPCDILLGWQW
jgi:hypothetical protein